MSIAKLTRESHRLPSSVQPEEEQPRVQDEQTCLEQHAAEYWDAITNEPLPTGLTSAARQEELGFMADWKVWDVVPVAQCWTCHGKPL